MTSQNPASQENHVTSADGETFSSSHVSSERLRGWASQNRQDVPVVVPGRRKTFSSSGRSRCRATSKAQSIQQAAGRGAVGALYQPPRKEEEPEGFHHLEGFSSALQEPFTHDLPARSGTLATVGL